ncbi:MAG: hypothetical protein F6K56_08365 [Moorea sp. SIO3G5]|nr:hypothetical protein [Moorena sp. SIO3G5]
MLFESLYAPESGVYVEQLLLKISPLQVDIWEQAWQQVVQRHSVLGTFIIWEHRQQALQVVLKDVDWALIWRLVPIAKFSLNFNRSCALPEFLKRGPNIPLTTYPAFHFFSRATVAVGCGMFPASYTLPVKLVAVGDSEYPSVRGAVASYHLPIPVREL